jgi:hypothetical protein
VDIKENLQQGISQWKFEGYELKEDGILMHRCRTHREFKVGDHVFLKVKSRHSSLNLGNCSKLETRYCGPF